MTHEQIEKKAYERFCWRQQNDISGNEKDDWEWSIYELFEEHEEEPYFHHHRRTNGA